jgi:HK97 family phage major capsid protein
LPDGIRADELSFGRWLRAVARGNWRGAEAEHEVVRAMSEGVDVQGGYAVPGALFGQVIDLARGQSVLLRAGARTVPMDTQELTVARVDGDLAATWKIELAEAPETGLTLGARVLTAKHLYALVPVSLELIEDAPNVGTALEQAFSAGLALELDRAGLVGDGAGATPTGIYFDPDLPAAQHILLGAGNGGKLSDAGYYDVFSDAIEIVAQRNGVADVAILSPREAGTLDRAKDGNGVPLQPPPSWEALRLKLASTQIPNDLVFGSATDGSIAFVGDFTTVWLGLRQGLVIESTREGLDNYKKGSVLFRARLRADWTIVRGGHIAVVEGIISEV